MSRLLKASLSIILLLCSSTLLAQEKALFRTDSSSDEKLPWYQIQPGVFPPEGSEHYFSGELIKVDHLKRAFILRVDRTDSQNRSHWDLPNYSVMLPYGSIFYNGTYAALEDIPLGTHLHGWFYFKDTEDKTPPLAGWHNRKSYEIDFTRCIRLEDDFSYYAKQNQLWRIDEVKLSEKKLIVTLIQGEEAIGKQKTFDLTEATQAFKGNSIVEVKDLKPGDRILFNLTWVTLYGPGRITQIWADQQARKIATNHQLKKHHRFVKDNGLFGWVDEVDNQKRIVTVTLFGNVDPELLKGVTKNSSGGLAVGKSNLMTYDPVNDRKSGSILEVNQADKEQGSSGIQFKIKPGLLLEGYRPTKIVCLYPSGWPVVALPKEKQYFGQAESE